MAFIDSHPPGRALDLGCGTGTNCITLAQHGWQVTGVDFVAKAIRKARGKARQAGLQIQFLQGDVTQVNGFEKPFDLIMDIGCFHSLSPNTRTEYVHNLPYLLTEDGTYLMYAWTSYNNATGAGLNPEDLHLLSTVLHQVSRQDGSERGHYPSAWFTYTTRS
jgi:cyclopropane fatty-acyl-phospholipid synthase-like methyltransferase